jgi:hypothetical protein
VAHQEVCTGATDETKGIIAWLHVFPEVNVGMVEDVRVLIQVVETLRRKDHADIIATVKVWQSLQEELLAGNLQRQILH